MNTDACNTRFIFPLGQTLGFAGSTAKDAYEMMVSITASEKTATRAAI